MLNETAEYLSTHDWQENLPTVCWRKYLNHESLAENNFMLIDVNAPFYSCHRYLLMKPEWLNARCIRWCNPIHLNLIQQLNWNYSIPWDRLAFNVLSMYSKKLVSLLDFLDQAGSFYNIVCFFIWWSHFNLAVGSGCVSVGKAVTSVSRSPWFESNYWGNLYYLYVVNCFE